MQAIVWWSVPLVAFVVAIVWVSVANRPRPPVDPHDSVAEHDRFREAMGRQVGLPGPVPPAEVPLSDQPDNPEDLRRDRPESPPGPGRPAP